LIHLTNAGRSASTINEAVCAISWAHRLTGLADPCKSDRGLVQTIREGSIRSVAGIPADSTDYIFRPLCFYKSVNSYKLKSGKLSSTTAREIISFHFTIKSVKLDPFVFIVNYLR
jgi:hypothetical protein